MLMVRSPRMLVEDEVALLEVSFISLIMLKPFSGRDWVYEPLDGPRVK